MNDFVIVGLENEASRGLFSRHSVGGRLIDQIGQNAHWQINNQVVSAWVTIHDSSILLLKLYKGKLHEAGEILAPYLQQFADPRRIIVLYDEALLPIGVSKLYTEPIVEATHMGIKSLIKVLGNGSFLQGAIGIDKIPTDKLLWDEFFNETLSSEIQENVSNCFASICAEIARYVETEIHTVHQISAEEMLNAQLPSRLVNLSLSPFCIPISKGEKKAIEKNVGQLLGILWLIANKYAHACNNDPNPDQNELVHLLEMGIPKEMVQLARSSSFHADGLSFDIQSGKLVEINASPMPPLTVMNLAHKFDIVGDKLSMDMLTSHVRRLVKRAQKTQVGEVILLDKIGEMQIGRTGWLYEVQKFLVAQGIATQIGNGKDTKDNAVIWANLTWMTEERIPSVVPYDNMKHVVIYPSPQNFLFTSKYFLALLHDEHAQEVFGLSRGQKELIQEFVPRTFVLSDMLAKTLLTTNTHWYMKPFLSSGGRGGGNLNSTKSARKIQRPAVIQEWAEPYGVVETNYKYDIRVIFYNTGTAKHLVWTARVWYGSETIARPMDALVTLNETD